MTLFQIPEAILEVLRDLPDDGVIDEIAQAKLDHLEVGFEDKIASYCALIKDYELKIPAIKARAARVAAKAKALDDRIAWLKENMKQAMLKLGNREISTDWYDVSLQRNGGKPKVTAEISQLEVKGLPVTSWPFVKVVPAEYVPDKDAIITAWEKGEKLPEGVKVERGEHISIK